MERLYMPFVPLVKLIITHFRPHLDELSAWWLASRLGANLFPGIENAQLILWPAGQKTPDGRTPREWKEQEGAVLLGVGGAKTKDNPDGAEYDEHGDGGENSTLTLMAGSLGLMTEPALQPLLKYSWYNDRKGKSTVWGLANILKMLNAYTVNTQQVAQFTFDILDAHYNRMLKADPSFTHHQHALRFNDQLAQWLWELFGGAQKSTTPRPATALGIIVLLGLEGREDLNQIIWLAKRDHTKGIPHFDIVTMFSELIENGGDASAQETFVYTIMNANFAQQRRFVAAQKEVHDHAVVTWVGDPVVIKEMRKSRVVEHPEALADIAKLEESEAAKAKDPDTLRTIKELKQMMVKPGRVGRNDHIHAVPGILPHQVVEIVSDNEEIIKAMRICYPEASFVIKHHRSGQLYPFINGKKSLMDALAAQVRIFENILRVGSDGPRIAPEDLRKPGNLPGDPWCYHREGGNLFNGSLTSPGGPNTRITHFMRCIAKALMYQARTDRSLRVPLPQKPTPPPNATPATS